VDATVRAGGRGDDAVVQRLVTAVGRASAEGQDVWRRTVLGCLDEVRGLLARDSAGPADWLEARRAHVARERTVLLDRISLQRSQVQGSRDLDRLAHDLRRFADDVRRHLQHVRDLAYDEVEYEVGGSE